MEIGLFLNVVQENMEDPSNSCFQNIFKETKSVKCFLIMKSHHVHIMYLLSCLSSFLLFN